MRQLYAAATNGETCLSLKTEKSRILKVLYGTQLIGLHILIAIIYFVL